MLAHLLWCCALIINFVPACTVFASMRNEFLSGGKSQGKFASNLYPLLIWWLGFLVFIQGTQVQFLVRKLRSRFLRLLTAASLRSVQFRSVAQSCPTLCDPMNHSMPGLPVHHQLPEFTQTHVHRVSDAIQPSYPLSSPSPPAPNPS